MSETRYVGRIAPTPSGHLHVGHAQTFLIAYKRALNRGGDLILRIEDLDVQRCKPHYLLEMVEDLNWIGISWTIGPNFNSDLKSDPYIQSNRIGLYQNALLKLIQKGYVYPSPHSRKDVERALSAPHEGDNEIIFPPNLRPIYMKHENHTEIVTTLLSTSSNISSEISSSLDTSLIPPSLSPLDISDYLHLSQLCKSDLINPRLTINWRFRIPDNRPISFLDQRLGPQIFIAGQEFGDFLVWRADGFPSYELAVVVDDADMAVTEVVRGQDLLLSTARQLLLYEALDLSPPLFFHCPLVRDGSGRRLAKSSQALSLRRLRDEGGMSLEQVMREQLDAESTSLLNERQI